MSSVGNNRESILTFSSGENSSSGSEQGYYRNEADTNTKNLAITGDAYIHSVINSTRKVDSKLKLLCKSMNILANEGKSLRTREIIDFTLRANIKPNVHMYTILVKAYNNAGLPHLCPDVIQEMRANNLHPNTRTFNQILSIYNRMCPVGFSKILNLMQEDNVEPDLHTFNCTLDNLCKMKGLDEAESYLDGCEKKFTFSPDTVSYNTMINAYAKLGNLEKAEKLLQKLYEKGLSPDTFTFTILIDAYGKANKSANSFEVFKKLINNQMIPSVITCNNLLGTLHRDHNHENIKFVLEQMKIVGVWPDERTYGTISEHISSLQTEQAKALLKLLERHELHAMDKTYGKLIDAYVLANQFEQAKQWYRAYFPLATREDEVDLYNCVSLGAAFIKVLLLLESPNKARKISVINSKDCYSSRNENMADFVWNKLKQYYVMHDKPICLESDDDDSTRFDIKIPWVFNPNAADYIPG